MYARFILYDINKFYTHIVPHPVLFALCSAHTTDRSKRVVFTLSFVVRLFDFHSVCMSHTNYCDITSIALPTNSNFTVTFDVTTWRLIKMFAIEEERKKNTRQDETWKLDKFQITPFYQMPISIWRRMKGNILFIGSIKFKTKFNQFKFKKSKFPMCFFKEVTVFSTCDSHN